MVLLPAGAHAAALKIFPVRMVLTPAEPVQTMTIQSSGTEKMRVQMRIFAWRQENGKDVFDETRDVLVNPGLFEIAPGGQQIARLGQRVSPGANEKSYRIFLEEVPNQQPLKQGEVRTLLRISIPIFVPAANIVGKLAWTVSPAGAGGVTVAIHNQGTVHVQIHRLTLTRADGAALGAQDMSAYLLPGASLQITLQVNTPVRRGDALKLSAMTDQADFSADLVSEPPQREVGAP